jgi:hypothetical protein
VVDAVGAKQLDRIARTLGSARLARVHGAFQASSAGTPEGLGFW